jgi:hypothetical protein
MNLVIKEDGIKSGFWTERTNRGQAWPLRHRVDGPLSLKLQAPGPRPPKPWRRQVQIFNYE